MRGKQKKQYNKIKKLVVTTIRSKRKTQILLQSTKSISKNKYKDGYGKRRKRKYIQ